MFRAEKMAALGQIMRALAVLLALAMFAEHSAGELVAFAGRCWSGELTQAK